MAECSVGFAECSVVWAKHSVDLMECSELEAEHSAAGMEHLIETTERSHVCMKHSHECTEGSTGNTERSVFLMESPDRGSEWPDKLLGSFCRVQSRRVV